MDLNKCPFCTDADITTREFTRNKLAKVFPTRQPIVPGHLLICPIRHVATIGELRPEELLAIMDLRMELAKALETVFGARGFNYAVNEGSIAGQSVPHLHLHIVPRKEGDLSITEYEPRVFLYRPGSRENSPEEELQAVSIQIRKALEM